MFKLIPTERYRENERGFRKARNTKDKAAGSGGLLIVVY